LWEGEIGNGVRPPETRRGSRWLPNPTRPFPANASRGSATTSCWPGCPTPTSSFPAALSERVPKRKRGSATTPPSWLPDPIRLFLPIQCDLEPSDGFSNRKMEGERPFQVAQPDPTVSSPRLLPQPISLMKPVEIKSKKHALPVSPVCVCVCVRCFDLSATIGNPISVTSTQIGST